MVKNPDILSADELFNDLSSKFIDDKDLLEKAYNFASDGHMNQKRASGEPYITHPLQVALYLSDLSMDLETIIAAILHDLIEDTDITYKNIKKEFGSDVANIVDGVTKLDRIQYNSNEEAKAEAIRKMVIAMSKDIRVLILKLADRLHNIQILGEVQKEFYECDRGKCRICGSSDNLHFDHILPFSKGGSSKVASNIQLLCARHNLKKGAKFI